MNLQLPKKRVLVAADYPNVAESIAEPIVLAAPFPVEVAIVSNGAQALAKAVADRPDCAFLDVDMPVLDGLAAAMAIRAALGPARPVLVALTGDSGHAERPGFHTAFDHLLLKPAVSMNCFRSSPMPGSDGESRRPCRCRLQQRSGPMGAHNGAHASHRDRRHART